MFGKVPAPCVQAAMVLHDPLTEPDGVAELDLHLRVLPDMDIAYLHLQKCAVKELTSICGVIVARCFELSYRLVLWSWRSN